MWETNISAELAGGEQGLDGGAKANNVEHGARRETLQCYHHGVLWKQEGTDRMEQHQRTQLQYHIRIRFCLTAAHFYTTYVGSTHTATTVNKEQQLSGGFVQLQRFTQQVRTKVEHQDGAAQNVLVVPLPHKLQLQAKWNIGMLAFITRSK